MKYPDLSVRTAVFGILSENDIAAYDSTADQDAGSSYVLLLNQDNIDFNSKSTYGFIHSLTLSAVVVSQISTGREEAEKLLNQVIELLTPTKPSDLVKIDLIESGFKCWLISAGKSKDLVFTDQTQTVYQKIVTLTLNIDSL